MDTRAVHTLEYHTCELPVRKPHQPEHRSEHGTVEEAIAAVPRGRLGYIDWSDANRRVIVERDGTAKPMRD